MEQTIKISTLNDFFTNKQKYFVNTSTTESYGSYEGSYDEYFKYYKHPDFPQNVFIRETIRTNSYKTDDFVYEMSLVEGKEKTITIFEPIN
jgi:hypothetical protein